MKDNELQSIWKGNIDKQVQCFSKEELDNMLQLKAKNKIQNFYSIKSTLIILGVIILFLAKTTFDHLGDALLVINNLLLLLCAVWGICVAIYYYNKMMNFEAEQPLKKWLEYRINILNKNSKYLYSYYFTFPVFILLANIAVTVFFDNLSFSEIVSSANFMSKSITNVIVSIVIAHFLRKYMLKQYTEIINNLEDLSKEITEKENEQS